LLGNRSLAPAVLQGVDGHRRPPQLHVSMDRHGRRACATAHTGGLYEGTEQQGGDLCSLLWRDRLLRALVGGTKLTAREQCPCSGSFHDNTRAPLPVRHDTCVRCALYMMGAVRACVYGQGRTHTPRTGSSVRSGRWACCRCWHTTTGLPPHRAPPLPVSYAIRTHRAPDREGCARARARVCVCVCVCVSHGQRSALTHLGAH
jgi:hypothetical protein